MHGNDRLEAKQNYLNALTDYLLGRASEDKTVDQDLVGDCWQGLRRMGASGNPSRDRPDLGYPRFDRVEANPFVCLRRCLSHLRHHQPSPVSRIRIGTDPTQGPGVRDLLLGRTIWITSPLSLTSGPTGSQLFKSRWCITCTAGSLSGVISAERG